MGRRKKKKRKGINLLGLDIGSVRRTLIQAIQQEGRFYGLPIRSIRPAAGVASILVDCGGDEYGAVVPTLVASTVRVESFAPTDFVSGMQETEKFFAFKGEEAVIARLSGTVPETMAQRIALYLANLEPPE
jgi:hypothetical protein